MSEARRPRPEEDVGGLDAPALELVAIVPSDDVINPPLRGIYVSAATTLSVQGVRNEAPVPVALAAGIPHPITATKITASSADPGEMSLGLGIGISIGGALLAAGGAIAGLAGMLGALPSAALYDNAGNQIHDNAGNPITFRAAPFEAIAAGGMYRGLAIVQVLIREATRQLQITFTDPDGLALAGADSLFRYAKHGATEIPIADFAAQAINVGTTFIAPFPADAVLDPNGEVALG